MNHTESPMNDDMNHSQIFEVLTAERNRPIVTVVNR